MTKVVGALVAATFAFGAGLGIPLWVQAASTPTTVDVAVVASGALETEAGCATRNLQVGADVQLLGDTGTLLARTQIDKATMATDTLCVFSATVTGFDAADSYTVKVGGYDVDFTVDEVESGQVWLTVE